MTNTLSSIREPTQVTYPGVYEGVDLWRMTIIADRAGSQVLSIKCKLFKVVSEVKSEDNLVNATTTRRK